MRNAVAAVALLFAVTASASTVNNDDSCDISQYPAATLLLPYFEVETATRGVDTFFTITNVGPYPQIARVTLWTDWAFPVLTFNVFLTGYDVQALSLYDIIVNGIIAPTNPTLTRGGTSNTTPPGALSQMNSANPNLSIARCEDLPGIVPQTFRQAVMNAFVYGSYNAAGFTSPCAITTLVGSPEVTHRTRTTAVGYATIDVVSNCGTAQPTEAAYYANDLLFDNVLTGDSITIDSNKTSNFAGGNPLVHIRAVPEGGPSGVVPVANQPATPMPYTFYGRYVNTLKIDGVALTPFSDRRQPLPSTFAARFIQGGAASFNTDFKIWREGRSGPATCSNAASNSGLPITEITRFDEHENPTTFSAGPFSPFLPAVLTLPAALRSSTASANFPPMNSPAGDTGGWIYLNLDSSLADSAVNTIAFPGLTGQRPSQNWVASSMQGSGSNAGLYGVEFDATALGNGCTPHAPASMAVTPTSHLFIGPNQGALVCPPGFVNAAGAPPCAAEQPPYTGKNTNP
jgi:hypothetical protein